MKKKLTAVALVVCMLAIMLVGASLAYFTDKDEEVNTFTVGNVSIDLIEKQFNKDSNTLEDFDQAKTLVPGTSKDGNAVSKIVTVKNTGNNDAWVWVDLKIPTYLVSREYPTNESKNALHWNSYGCFNVEYNSGNYWSLATSNGIVDANHQVTDSEMVAVDDGLWYDYEFVSKDDEYVTIRTKMQNALPAGKISLPCLAQVYMDWRVTTNEDGTQFILPAGNPISTDASWKIIVNAYAIQADGIASVDAAITAYANNGN